MTAITYMSCPRNCGVDARDHNSSDQVDGHCDTGPARCGATDGESVCTLIAGHLGAHEDDCQWFAGCGELPTTTRFHPALGHVPCCDRCAAI